MTKKKDPKDLLPVGRPREPFDLPEGWQNMILKGYAEGMSDAEIRVIIRGLRPSGRFNPDLWYEWIDREPEFAQTIKEGKDVSRAWWEQMGRLGIKGQINYTGWLIQVRNRFGYATPENDEEQDTPKQIEDNTPKINVLPKSKPD